jgi:predicted DsbA family dithiol-disulfide isomerase
MDARDPAWSALTRGVALEARREGLDMMEPEIVPWTRKAHELAFLARESGRFAVVHRALFAAHFQSSSDIGRIDVLVAIGKEHGLEPALTRTVLGTDRFSAAVLASAERARALGVRGVPTFWREGMRLEGLQSVASFDSFLTSIEADSGTTTEERGKWPVT